VYLAHLIDATGIVKDTLGGGSLTGVNVGNNAYISCSFQRKRSGHFLPPFWILGFGFWIGVILLQNPKSKIQNR
jgi:hypothetical protein